jgi:uncharacterized pyridoxamine 5'-phosphate oxidase family protein
MNDPRHELRQEIWEHFVDQQHVFLATAEGSQPRVRPVTLIRLENRLLVATGSKDAKVLQIERNPKIEFCLLVEEGEKQGTIRAECIAKIVEDLKLKTTVFTKAPFMKEFFKTPSDPNYALVELKPTKFEYMRPDSIEAIRVTL